MARDNKKDYKKLYGELDIKYDWLLERHCESMNTLCYVRDLINDLQRTERYEDVHALMLKRVIEDIKKAVLNNIIYEETIHSKQKAKENE